MVSSYVHVTLNNGAISVSVFLDLFQRENLLQKEQMYIFKGISVQQKINIKTV